MRLDFRSRRRAAERRAPTRDLEAELAAATQGIALLERIVDMAGDGVLVLNEVLTPVMANRSARTMLGMGGTLPPTLPHGELNSLARRALKGGREVTQTLDLQSPARVSLHIRAISLDDHDCIVMVVRDASSEQHAQQVRRQFVAHASHELKSPVSAIGALAEAIHDAVGADPEKAKDFSARLVEEAHRVGALVGDLLDLSRLEEPTTISSLTVEMSEIARAQIAEIKQAADAKNLRIVDRVHEGLAVRGDGAQLGVMLRNLLDNAVRYTPENGNVEVELVHSGPEVTLTVRDDGPGIPLSAQSRVFERFYRVDEARSREHGGTGLGLAIVKHIAELHGGSVALDSDLGKGSAFTVRLLAARDDDQG